MKMKRNKLVKPVTAVLAVVLLAGVLAACGNNNSAGGGKTEDNADAREIIVAVAPGFYPITYADDDGNAAGYDVEVFKALDEILPEYTFKFEVADKETMNVGVQSGRYQVGINSLFKTDERKETYYLPENNMGYTAVGIIQREDDNITDLANAYDNDRIIYPVFAAGGIRLVLNNWNEANPDKKIDYELVTAFNYADMFASVLAGDYDYDVDLIPVFNLQPAEAVAGLKITDPVDVVPTYPIVNKAETELGDKIDAGLAQLKEAGTLSKLSVDAFGYDVFAIAD